jgi:hypothetical protein
VDAADDSTLLPGEVRDTHVPLHLGMSCVFCCHYVSIRVCISGMRGDHDYAGCR